MFPRPIKDKKLFKAIIAFAVAILIFFVWLYFHGKIVNVSQKPVLNTYYNQDYKYSLAIPDDWIGKYTATEIKKGDTSFVYIGDQDKKLNIPIFIMHAVPDSQWLDQKNSPDAPVYITENNGYTYTYSAISNNNLPANLDKKYLDEFSNMAGEVKDIVKTIKFSQ